MAFVLNHWQRNSTCLSGGLNPSSIKSKKSCSSIYNARKEHLHIILWVLFLFYHLCMYKNYNANPSGKRTEDCVTRAISLALGIDWESAYLLQAFQGLRMHDKMDKNYVWGQLLEDRGFVRKTIPDTCPSCYTVADFAQDHPHGTYILGTGDHAVAVIDGDWFDTWDSGDAVPIVCYRRK